MKSHGKRAPADSPWPFVETHADLQPAEQEWLHTNGAGAYSMSTVAMMPTAFSHSCTYGATWASVASSEWMP